MNNSILNLKRDYFIVISKTNSNGVFLSYCENVRKPWHDLMMCVDILQSYQLHDVHSAVPCGHLCSPGGVCGLLGGYCFVSIIVMFACVYMLFSGYTMVCNI